MHKSGLDKTSIEVSLWATTSGWTANAWQNIRPDTFGTFFYKVSSGNCDDTT